MTFNSILNNLLESDNLWSHNLEALLGLDLLLHIRYFIRMSNTLGVKRFWRGFSLRVINNFIREEHSMYHSMQDIYSDFITCVWLSWYQYFKHYGKWLSYLNHARTNYNTGIAKRLSLFLSTMLNDTFLDNLLRDYCYLRFRWECKDHFIIDDFCSLLGLRY